MPPIEAPITWAGASSSSLEQAGRIVGHVGERVVRRATRARQQLREARRTPRDVRGAADVAIVEANDEQSAGGELLAEVLLPGDHLSAQPHDQQSRRVGWLPEGLIAEGHTPADIAKLLGHDRRL